MPAARRVLSCLEEAVYAVVRTGGKQYRVEEGRAVTIERLAGEPGDSIELGDVLLLGEGDHVTVGAPVIQGARVLGTIAEQGRSRKIIVFRYKAKTRARKKNGHRQQFTRLVVSDILAPGQEPKPKAVAAAPEPTVAEAPKGRRRRGKQAEAEAAVAEAPAAAEEAVTEAPAQAESETLATPRRRTRKTEE
jgi:large subunit ribosomal protein L21